MPLSWPLCHALCEAAYDMAYYKACHDDEYEQMAMSFRLFMARTVHFRSPCKVACVRCSAHIRCRFLRPVFISFRPEHKSKRMTLKKTSPRCCCPASTLLNGARKMRAATKMRRPLMTLSLYPLLMHISYPV